MPNERRPDLLDTAQHEAAHVVVALALGVRVTKASAVGDLTSWGYIEHSPIRERRPLEDALIAAAGLIYEEGMGNSPTRCARAADDYRQAKAAARRAGVRLSTVRVLAAALLHDRAYIHAQVAAALCEQDLTAADLRAIARSEFKSVKVGDVCA